MGGAWPSFGPPWSDHDGRNKRQNPHHRFFNQDLIATPQLILFFNCCSWRQLKMKPKAKRFRRRCLLNETSSCHFPRFRILAKPRSSLPVSHKVSFSSSKWGKLLKENPEVTKGAKLCLSQSWSIFSSSTSVGKKSTKSLNFKQLTNGYIFVGIRYQKHSDTSRLSHEMCFTLCQ